MTKEIKKYLFHYLFLAIILFFGVVIFMMVGFDKTLQLNVAILTIASYFLWGIIHHFLKDDLHIKVVIEYLLITALSLILVLSLLYRL
ncbi:hypothetical protein HY345_02385 [Candidatus Microgenomates bacterium]|nr:hypothetical protein [Candidatus Microgenomates bacterium]